MDNEFSHFDDTGASRMVDVGSKPITQRIATASGRVRMQPTTWRAIQDQTVSKGDVLGVARLAGIMAAKRTGDLSPLCHPLGLDAVEVSFALPQEGIIEIEATVRTTGRTGVEMEALTSVSIAGLTIYDMCKSADRDMRLEQVQLEAKSGGRSGDYVRTND